MKRVRSLRFAVALVAIVSHCAVRASPDDNPAPVPAAETASTTSAAPIPSASAVSLEPVDYVPPPRSIENIRYELTMVRAGWGCEKDEPVPLQELHALAVGGSSEVTRHLIGFARNELHLGNLARATWLVRAALDEVGFGGWHNARAWAHSIQARVRAAAGDLDGAMSAAGRTAGTKPQSRAVARHGQAAAEQLAGNFAQAEVLLREAKEHFARSERASGAHYVYELDTDLAKTFALQGRYNEAELAVREILSAPPARIRPFVRGSALAVLARVMLEQGRFADAETVSAAAINAYLSGQVRCDSVFYNQARLLRAEARTAQGRYGAAIREFDAIRRDLQVTPALFESQVAGSVGWGVALLGAGRPDEARERFSLAVEQASERLGDRSYATAEARGLLAASLIALGRREEATAAFTRALPVLVEHANVTQAGAAATSLRALRLALVVEHYLELIGRSSDSQAVAEGFRIADVARGRSVQRAIVASSVRAAARDPALSALVRKSQQAGRQAQLVFDSLTLAFAQPPGEVDRALVSKLERRFRTLQQFQAETVRAIEAQDPRYADLVNPKLPTVDEVRAALAPDEAFIAMYAGLRHTFVWAFRSTGPIAFHASPLGADALATAVGTLRLALEPEAETIAEIPDFDVATAHRLYRQLLEPVRSGFEGASTLVIVPHGALASLPLSVLVTRAPGERSDAAGEFSGYRKVEWLGTRVATGYVPTGAAFVAMRRAPPAARATKPLAAFADPVFSTAAKPVPATPGSGQIVERGPRLARRSVPLTRRMKSATLAALPPLPDTRGEVEAVARSLGAVPVGSLFLGVAANEETVKSTDLSDRRVVVFATHGLAAGDLDGLYQPALALSSPAASKTEGDGLLAMGEILGLELGADWVVLSACNTAAADGAGAEAVSGLGRAFLYAGARSVLVTHWPVETTSAKALTAEVFRRYGLGKETRAGALKEAIAWMIAEGGTEHFTYAHPLFWAPFTLIGDGAR